MHIRSFRLPLPLPALLHCGFGILILISPLRLSANDLGQLVREGDILFSISQSAQSQAIQLATHSRYSHVGMLLKVKDRMMVLEAVEPVRYYDFRYWTTGSNHPHFVIKRLRDADSVLTNEVLEAMRTLGNSFVGKRYDAAFSWSDDRLYCSELVWKIYWRSTGIEIGKRRRIRDFDLSNPIVRSKMRERYGEKIPYDEEAISPGDMFSSDRLITIYSH